MQNSAWGRLSDAWQIAPPGAAVRFRARGDLLDRAVPLHEPPTDPLVLVAGCSGAAALAQAPRLASTAVPAQRYRVLSIGADKLSELIALLAERAPRVLLIDAALCEELGSTALRQMRRLNPAVQWVIGWDEAAPRWLPVLIDTQARGCIAWAAAPEQLSRALDAVVAGQLWFPRSVSQWLYAALLRSVGGGASAHDGEAVAAATCATELSAREGEVMALMREGLTNKQIGERLNISVNTVKKHLAHAFEKRGLHRRRQELA